MTANRKQKNAARARAAEQRIPYAAARRADTDPSAAAAHSAETVAGELADQFWAAGWPVVVEHVPQSGQRLLYAGPVRVSVEDPNLDPDDDGLSGTDAGEPAPPAPEPGAVEPAGTVWLSAPYTDPQTGGYDQELPGTTPPAQIVAAAAEGLTVARRRALDRDEDTAACVICEAEFPAGHLLAPTREPHYRACPLCAFDGDMTVYYEDPASLTFQLDPLLGDDLAAPAGWAAVAVLLAETAGEDLPERLERAWRAAGTVYLPLERWHDPDRNWIWLPNTDRRPGWLAGLGPVARPSALVAAIDTAHPELRAAYQLRWSEEFLDEADEPVPAPATLALGWRLAVVFAVALHTEATEHPERGEPWDVLESFEALGGHVRELGGQGDPILIEAMIAAGTAVLREHDLLQV